jgi:hypothetical protein
MVSDRAATATNTWQNMNRATSSNCMIGKQVDLLLEQWQQQEAAFPALVLDR